MKIILIAVVFCWFVGLCTSEQNSAKLNRSKIVEIPKLNLPKTSDTNRNRLPIHYFEEGNNDSDSLRRKEEDSDDKNFHTPRSAKSSDTDSSIVFVAANSSRSNRSSVHHYSPPSNPLN